MNITLWSADTETAIVNLLKDISKHFITHKEPVKQFKLSIWDSYDQQLLKNSKIITKIGNFWQVWNLKTFSPLGEGTTKKLSENSPKYWDNYEESFFQKFLRENLDLYSIIKLADFNLMIQNITISDSIDKKVASLSVLITGNRYIVRLSALKGFEDEMRIIWKSFSAFFSSINSEEIILAIFHDKNLKLLHQDSLADLIPGNDVPVRNAASDIILFYLHTARYYETGVIKDLDTECLHNYRVSLRKIRTMLSIIKGIFPLKDRKRLKNELKEIQQHTNQLRDLDVFLMEEKNYTRKFPEELKILSANIFTLSKLDRKRIQESVKNYISSKKYKETIQKIELYFQKINIIPHSGNSKKPLDRIARDTIKDLYKKIHNNIAEISSDSPDELIHELRITGKKLRYALEFFEPVLDNSIRIKLIVSLKEIQNELGRFNDLSVQTSHLIKRTINIKENENLLALGIMIGVLHNQHDVQREIVLDKIHSLNSGEIKSLVKMLTS